MRICRFLSLILVCVGIAPAPAQLKLSGTHRTRYEAISGQARAGFGREDDLLNFRTTLAAEYRRGAVTVAAELWDSRAYLADRRTPVTTGEVNALEPVQLSITGRLGAVLGPGSTVTVQVGRFLLNLGSRRLVAADDYRNTTNGYTGARVDMSSADGWRGTMIYTLPQSRRPDTLDALLDNRAGLDRENFGLVLWGGVASKAKAISSALVETSFFHLGERDAPGRPTRDRSLDTLAVRAIREPAPARPDFEVELIGQRGHASTSTAAAAPVQQVRAWFGHAELGYTFGGAWHPRLAIEYDHASGDRPGGRYGRFDTLFGMRRADLAPAGLYNAIARANILTPGLRIEAGPQRGTDIMLSAHPMWAASRSDSFASANVRDASRRSGRFAGNQLDGRIRHKLSRNLTLEADGVLLRKGRLLRDAPNAPPGRWTRYMSLNATASFP